ncbi:MAG: M43 family zinc metalloprotease [Bacteroidota bacterium]
MKKVLLTFAGILMLSFGYSQELKCGLQEKLNALYAQDPQMELEYHKLIKNSQNSEKDYDSTTVYTVPIVFHVLHENGTENISDLQVYDAVEILNEDFRAMNADTAGVVAAFKQIYGDAKIEFKLARFDPYGNCTNGIEHIYTHEANNADDFSKLQQWPRYRYLNVWVTNTIGEAGVAGYAYYPTATDGAGFFRDGIIILNDYIGSFGTSSAYGSRALTHEIGHYLGLAHCWGSTNDPGVSCGDDGINDTPYTIGQDLFCNVTNNSCPTVDPFYGIDQIDNVQNFMEYSYCSKMYTKLQGKAMRNILTGISGQRNQLIDTVTAELTGMDLTTAPPCQPIADFHSTKQYSCLGDALTFEDDSYNGAPTAWEWTFYEGASTQTSNLQNPSITFTTTGYKKVRLVVSNALGSDTLVKDNYVGVWNTDWSYIGPHSFDLNTIAGNSDNFLVFNNEDNHSRFSMKDQYGYDNSKCFKLNTHFDHTAFYPYSNEGLYFDRLGGTKDAIVTPPFNLSNTSSVNVTFKYAYATNALSEDEITEKIVVYSSKNCGDSWTPRKTITGAELNSIGYAGYADVNPTSNTQWKTATVNYNAQTSDINTIFKIEFEASDKASNLFIDDININGTLGVNELDASLDLNVFPNPVGGSEELTVQYLAGNEAVAFDLRDAQGKSLMTEVRNEINQEVSFNLNTTNLSAGCYYLVINSNGFTTTKKVLVF